MLDGMKKEYTETLQYQKQADMVLKRLQKEIVDKTAKAKID